MELNKIDVLIDYISELVGKDYKVKSEYNTNFRDEKIIVIQEHPGEKIVFFENIEPLFDYYEITIFTDSIREAKATSELLGGLIGKSIYRDYEKFQKNRKLFEKWKIIFKQYSNPQTIEYKDIRRVGYNLTLQTIINEVYRKEI